MLLVSCTLCAGNSPNAPSSQELITGRRAPQQPRKETRAARAHLSLSNSRRQAEGTELSNAKVL